MPYFQDALGLLVEVLLGLYLVAVILRFLFQLLRVDFRNPITATVVRITNPPLRLLHRFIPGLFGFDLATVVLVLVVAYLKYFLLVSFAGLQVSVSALLVYSAGESINTACWILLISIFGSAILSWIAPHSYHPAARILGDLSNPLLLPFRRFMPNLGGLDLSPIFAILAISLVQRLVVNPLMDFGHTLI